MHNPNIIAHYNKLFLTLLFCLITYCTQAQDVFELASDLYKQGRFADAAEQYERAWRLKSNRNDYLFKAGECYFWVKDYRKAIECFKIIKRENEKFELVGLKYARALKQDGRYKDAIEEFKWFAKDYKGPGKGLLDRIIVNDIRGCEMGIELATAAKPKELPIEVQLLPEYTNSPENDFAPLPYTNDALYYTSYVQGNAKLFRTIRQDGTWSQPEIPQGLPELTKDQLGSGCFSSDGQRYYYTTCSKPDPDKTKGNPLHNHCEIFVIQRKDDSWTAPIRLRDYINMPNTASAHPYVVTDGQKEILFFSSDRESGLGGMDIFYCERPLNSEDFDFTFPKGLGPKINTGGDDICPFYDPISQTLYFSSNGHVSLGGMDIFKSLSINGQWAEPENLGVPFNSTADDYYFILKKAGTGGFFVSNRYYGRAKPSTRHDDIFEFLPRENKLYLSGKIFDSQTKRNLADVNIALYEVQKDRASRFLQEKPSGDGYFSFQIAPDRLYDLEVTKDGYGTQTRRFDPSKEDLNTDILITLSSEKGAKMAKSESNETAETSKGSAVSPPKPEITNLETQTGPFYRVQIEAVPYSRLEDSKYDYARKFGTLTSEWVEEKKIYRILVGDFPDKKKAMEIAKNMREKPEFVQAFIVRYLNGRRTM